jgi:hypothetical protein
MAAPHTFWLGQDGCSAWYFTANGHESLAVSVFGLCLTILKDGALSGAEIGLEREDRYGSFVPVLDLLPDDVHCSERLLSRARWSTSTRSGGGSDA